MKNSATTKPAQPAPEHSSVKSPRQLIVTLPHPPLRARSKKVGVVSQQIQDIIAKMEAATLDWEDHRKHEVGVALAAIQIDQPYRIVIIRNSFKDKNDRSFKVFINPEIIKLEGDIVEDYEGCLSIKDIYGKVPRHNKVRIRALDVSGRQFRVTATGFLARVFQHEIDHTKGKLFIDHIKTDPTAFFKLNSEGKLEALDYERSIKNSRILW